MEHEYELNFLRDLLKKSHVSTVLLSTNDPIDALIGTRLANIIGVYSNIDVTIQKTFGVIENSTKYNLTTTLKLRYVFMRLPIMSEKNILFIGPYLSAPLSSKEVLEIGEELKLPINTQRLLKEYYFSLPVIPDNDRLFSVIDLFCERLWEKPSFAIVEMNGSEAIPVSQLNLLNHGRTLDETVATMEMMEARYSFENELIQAVALGQQHKEKMLLSIFNEQMFEKRLQDPLRNAKNYCVIMNTLLRKAAKARGVKISCDLNYRGKLWTRAEAREAMTKLCEYVDVCISNEEDAKDVFGIEAEGTDIYGGKLNHEGYKSVAKQLADRFGFEKVAITLRSSISANDNDWAGMLYDGENYCFSKSYHLHIVDRVGGGDSFGGGLIYALLSGKSTQEAIEFAVAASALKHSIEGDYNRVGVAEVEKLAGGDGSGRVQR